jgi:hypothetical protein
VGPTVLAFAYFIKFLAAHCVFYAKASDYRVILGDHNIEVFGDGEQFINIEQIIVVCINLVLTLLAFKDYSKHFTVSQNRSISKIVEIFFQ